MATPVKDYWKELLEKGDVGFSVESNNVPVSPEKVSLFEIRAPYSVPFTITLFQSPPGANNLNGVLGLPPFGAPLPADSTSVFCIAEWSSGGGGPAIAEVSLIRGRVFTVHGSFLRLALSRPGAGVGNTRVGAFVSLLPSALTGRVYRSIQFSNAGTIINGTPQRVLVPPMALDLRITRNSIAAGVPMTSIDVSMIDAANAVIGRSRWGTNVPHEMELLPLGARAVEVANNDVVNNATAVEAHFGLAL